MVTWDWVAESYDSVLAPSIIGPDHAGGPAAGPRGPEAPADRTQTHHRTIHSQVKLTLGSSLTVPRGLLRSSLTVTRGLLRSSLAVARGLLGPAFISREASRVVV